MSRSRLAIFTVLAVLLALNLSGSTAAAEEPVPANLSGEIQVTVSAPYTTLSWDERDPERVKFDVPLVYLHRQREATPAAERTIEITVSGLPPSTEIQVELVSHHLNVATGEPHKASQDFVAPGRTCTSAAACVLRWTLDAATTPSDLYYLQVREPAGETLWEEPRWPALAALDTWDVSLGDHAVHITYATLFPFARGERDFDNRLPPAAVTGFIEHKLVPIIRETWRTQFEEWGFGQPLHPDWDPDEVVDVIITAPPFALFDGTGTYSAYNYSDGTLYPERRIWWFSNMSDFQVYDTLENGYKAVFAHEFFHLVQWNVLLSTGRPTSYWRNAFVEAQAAFAVSVQYPELELQKDHVVTRASHFGIYAKRFLAHQLNTSYRDLDAAPTDKYDAALYWRFLYEQYNDMGIIRAALDEMARHYDADILAGMESAVNAAFARVDGPFDTYEESLVAFARANYALRLDNGRCETADFARCGGRFYDPHRVYADPPLEAQLTYDGTRLRDNAARNGAQGADYGAYYGLESAAPAPTPRAESGDTDSYSGAIPASYGMDFIEVLLEPVMQGRPLTVTFEGEGDVARFNVQIWKLGPGEIKPRAVTVVPEVAPQEADGVHIYAIPRVDTAAFDRLAIIITRLDAEETLDPAGSYRLTVYSGTKS